MQQCSLGEIPKNDPIGYCPGLNDYSVFDSPEWLNAVNEIWKALSYNDMGWRGFTVLLGSSPYEPNQIEQILNSYIQFITEYSNIPEYNPTSNYDYSVLITNISNESAQKPELVQRVLNQLYYYTQDGTIKSRSILEPRSTNKNIKDFKGTSPLKKVVNAFENIGEGLVDTVSGTGTILKYLPYILLTGIAATGIYYGSKVYNNIQEQK